MQEEISTKTENEDPLITKHKKEKQKKNEKSLSERYIENQIEINEFISNLSKKAREIQKIYFPKNNKRASLYNILQGFFGASHDDEMREYLFNDTSREDTYLKTLNEFINTLDNFREEAERIFYHLNLHEYTRVEEVD